MSEIKEDSPQFIDWADETIQNIWFENFKLHNANGLKFGQFQDFLRYALYSYISKFPDRQQLGGPSQEQNITAAEFSFPQQKEMLLFKRFDRNNDHIIDRKEFCMMCNKWLVKIYRPRYALINVDVQNDFIDGSLALINGPAGQDGVEVVPVVNQLMKRCRFSVIVYTLDWHPANHISFHANLNQRKYLTVDQFANENNNDDRSSTEKGKQDKLARNPEVVVGRDAPGDGEQKFKLNGMNSDVKVFDTVIFNDGQMKQKLWPTHCIQNTWGAQLHPKLEIADGSIFIRKGTLPHVDAYSAFWDNLRLNETNLRKELINRGVTDIFVCGLALDYCVLSSAIDGVRAGFTTYVIEDACRGIDLGEMDRRKEEATGSGVIFVNSEDVVNITRLLDCNNKILDGCNNMSKTFHGFGRNLIADVFLKKALT